jgi:hypothetical protein
MSRAPGSRVIAFATWLLALLGAGLRAGSTSSPDTITSSRTSRSPASTQARSRASSSIAECAPSTSWSCNIPSRVSGTSARSWAPIVMQSSDSCGLRLCGIVELPHRSRRRRLAHLGQFGLHQTKDLQGDPRPGRAEQAEQAHVLGEAVDDRPGTAPPSAPGPAGPRPHLAPEGPSRPSEAKLPTAPPVIAVNTRPSADLSRVA